MNKIAATIKNIKNVDALNLVEFDYGGVCLSMVALELHNKIKVSQKVILGFKSTQITIAKDVNCEQISFTNQIKMSVETLEKGEILSAVFLKNGDDLFEALILTKSFENMNLQKGDDVVALLKSTEISILEFLE